MLDRRRAKWLARLKAAVCVEVCFGQLGCPIFLLNKEQIEGVEMKANEMKMWLSDFMQDEEGASGIEYALVASMVAIALVAFVTPIKTAITAVFSSIAGSISA